MQTPHIREKGLEMVDVMNLQFPDDDPRHVVDAPQEEKISMVSVLSCYRSEVSVVMCATLGRR